MKNILVTLMLLFPISGFSQEFSCQESFDWAKETFQKNDAGFRYSIEKKGANAFRKHNQEFISKAEDIKGRNECYKLIQGWMSFFRKGHFGIRPIIQDEQPTSINENWEGLDIDTNDFKEYLKNSKDTLEGIWESGSYIIGIKNVKNEYKGFIIASTNNTWKTGEVKLTIHSDSSATYFMGNRSPLEIEKVEFLGAKYIRFGFINLQKIYPIPEIQPEIDRYFRSISSTEPYLEPLNENTLFLRIPSFASFHKSLIDSLLTENHGLITSTENLIIDLRNNGGGNDKSFESLLPVIYTNPIETVGMAFYSSPRNNERLLSIIDHPNASEEVKEWARNGYNKLSENVGTFVNLETTSITTTEFDTVYNYPKSIGIIINENSVSTTEQFLLAARQSRKVKLYGRSTFGALDISNLYSAKSPHGDFELIYSLSRSLRLPEMPVDETGIAPDFFIYDHTPNYQWINYIMKRLK